MHHFIGKYTKRPPVSTFIIPSSFKNFRSQIFGGSTKSFGCLSISNYFSHSKISETDISILVHQDVFQLKITIDKIFGVEVSKSKSNLHGIEFSLFFREFFLIRKVLEQLSSL